MNLSLGASLGATLPSRPPLQQLGSAAAPNTASGRPRRLRVTAQAFGSTPKQPGRPQRVREQSPSKARAAAAAAPVWETTQQAATAAPAAAPHLAGGNTIVKFANRQLLHDLERQFNGPAAPGVEQAAPAEQQQQQDSEQQADEQQSTNDAGRAAAVAAVESRLRERRQQSAAASTSGRGLQQQAERPVVVLSTRQARGARAVAAGQPKPSTAAARRALRAADTTQTEASTVVLASWLLDCSSRRQRGARQAMAAAALPAPAAAAAAPAAAAGSASKRRSLRRQAPALQLSPAAAEGLSAETQEDMLVLINARAGLRAGRFRRSKASSRQGRCALWGCPAWWGRCAAAWLLPDGELGLGMGKLALPV